MPVRGGSATAERGASASRVRRAYTSATTRSAALSDHGRTWIESRDPATWQGATIGWVQRYQAADGQLYAVLLAAYFFLTCVPLLLVETSYVYSDPTALAQRLERRLHLEGETSNLLSQVMVGASNHKIAGALIAVVNLFFFGRGFGRVLQLAHARSWRIDLRKSAVVDQLRYVEVLVVLFALTLLFVIQTKALRGAAPLIVWTVNAGWVAALLGFFVWAPRLLLHHRVRARDILPGALFTVCGFVAMRLISVVLLKRWFEWYSRTYGSIGIVMAMFFWMIALATIMILAAALSPALAARRELRGGPLG